MTTSPSHPDELDLMAYVDRELPDPLRAHIRGHLGSCERCRARTEAWENLFARVESGAAVDEHIDVRTAVMRSLRRNRASSRSVRLLLIGELAASVGLLVVLFGAFSRLGPTLLQLFEPLALQLVLTQSWDQFVFWIQDSLNALIQAAALAWEGIQVPPINVSLPASWWPWLAALAAVWLLGNGLLLTGKTFLLPGPTRKGEQRG